MRKLKYDPKETQEVKEKFGIKKRFDLCSASDEIVFDWTKWHEKNTSERPKNLLRKSEVKKAKE